LTPIQKAKEVVFEYKKHCYQKGVEMNGYTFDQWAALPEAAALLSGEAWISVEGGNLPEYDKYVLVFGERIGSPQMGGALITIGRRQDLKGTSIAKDASRYQDKNQFSQMAYVTNWMYLPAKPALPEPPKSLEP
jgi:hypothetical protein